MIEIYSQQINRRERYNQIIENLNYMATDLGRAKTTFTQTKNSAGYQMEGYHVDNATVQLTFNESRLSGELMAFATKEALESFVKDALPIINGQRGIK